MLMSPLVAGGPSHESSTSLPVVDALHAQVLHAHRAGEELIMHGLEVF